MDDMRTSRITQMSDHQRGGRRVQRAIEARRGLASTEPKRDARPPRGGRAWINGLELGGTDTRHLPLAVQFD